MWFQKLFLVYNNNIFTSNPATVEYLVLNQPLPTLNKAYSLLHREEKHCEVILVSIDYVNGIDVNFEQVDANSTGRTFSFTGPHDNQSESHFKECPHLPTAT